MQTENAAEKVGLLLRTQTDAVGIRIGMTNDWGSYTGFSYTMGFVTKGDVQASDEKIELAGGGVVYVERKALWAGEGGLLGASLDIDENFNMIVTPKEPQR